MQITNIEVRHASEPVARRVRTWFMSDRRAGAVDGNRSIHLPHPERYGFTLKIKGAGFNGGSIRFGKFSPAGPDALTFDFDGRATRDVASSHNNAYLGGASYQQAATEYNVTRYAEQAGFGVVPCLGYGRIDTELHSAWFSIFEWHRGWKSASIPRAGPLAGYLETIPRITELMLQLATRHDIVGYCGLVATAPGEYLLKDLHPFRRTDPITDSQISWLMQFLFALNVRCQSVLFFSNAVGRNDLPADFVAHALRPVLADATVEDYEAMRTRIVKPYLRLTVEVFDPSVVVKALRDTRMGSALLDLCPEKYPRW